MSERIGGIQHGRGFYDVEVTGPDGGSVTLRFLAESIPHAEVQARDHMDGLGLPWDDMRVVTNSCCPDEECDLAHPGGEQHDAEGRMIGG